MIRSFGIMLLCCLTLWSHEKVVMFPCMMNSAQTFLNEKHPNPCIHVWPKIKHKLAEKGIELIITETKHVGKRLLADPEVKYYITHNCYSQRKTFLSKIPKEKSVLWIWEPATVNPEFYRQELHSNFAKIFTFDDTLLQSSKYLKFYHPHNLSMIDSVVPFEEKKFLCLMNACKTARPRKLWLNYYAERLKVINFYEKKKPGELHLYGRNWGKHPSAKGVVADKTATIKNYKFCICYENTNTPGYVTEKMFDCFYAGVIPVYLGAENVTETIPESCFINRRKFECDEAVYQYMRAMDKETYERYLQNIREYLASDQGYVYTPEHFIESFINWVTK